MTSKSLLLAEKLLNSIVSADPNVIENYKDSDIIIRDLYEQCKKLVESLSDKNLHPAIVHMHGADKMSPETISAVNEMVDVVINNQKEILNNGTNPNTSSLAAAIPCFVYYKDKGIERIGFAEYYIDNKMVMVRQNSYTRDSIIDTDLKVVHLK